MTIHTKPQLKKLCIGLSILGAFALGILVQKYLSLFPEEVSGTQTPSTTKEKKIKYWVAPMDAAYRRDKPGKSPMGMDLVPVYEEGASGEEDKNAILISPTIEHNLGVRTALVTRKGISRLIETVGSISADENQIEHVHVYADGWIKELLVKAEGEKVAKGQTLFRVYSPALVNAQEEYILALNNKNTSLSAAALKKLAALGMSKAQIETLQKNRTVSELVDVVAEESGIVSHLNVRDGMFVKPEKILLVIEDLSKVWLLADVYERQSSWVQKGQKAEMSLPYLPGQKWIGEVNYVYPTLDANSQTLKVRMMFDNPSGDLKVNMFGDVKIHAQPRENILMIPREAVIYTGQENRVIVKLDTGKYVARPIKVGLETSDFIEIIDGLKEGETIVTSAQFLIDSESSLKASFNRLDNGGRNEKNAINSHTNH